jgi:hypothetical protein
VKINFKLYLDKYKFYQSISRWYWNQKRQSIFDKLFVLFEEYKKMYDKVKMNEIRNSNMFNQLLKDIIVFNNILIEKLLLLKTTYNDESVSILIDKIIKIIDINKEISEIN